MVAPLRGSRRSLGRRPTVPGDARVVLCVLWISMPEVILHRAQIGALVSEAVAATVAQHVRPDPAKLRGLAGHPDDVVHGLARELRLPLGDEQPGEIVLAGGEVALDGAQLVASDRLLDGERVLQASHPEPGALDINCLAPHLDGLAHAQAVTVDRQYQRIVADAMASLLGRL